MKKPYFFDSNTKQYYLDKEKLIPVIPNSPYNFSPISISPPIPCKKQIKPINNIELKNRNIKYESFYDVDNNPYTRVTENGYVYWYNGEFGEYVLSIVESSREFIQLEKSYNQFLREQKLNRILK